MSTVDPSLSSQSGLDADLAAVVDAGEKPAADRPAISDLDEPSSSVFDADFDRQYETIQALLEQVKIVSNRPLPPFAQTQLPQMGAAKSVSTPPIRGNIVSWFVISLGLMLFVCGSILVGWSIVASRGELWRVGLPIALIGQATLVVGVALQVESLWFFHRQTNRQLERLDEELQRLQQSTRLLTPSRNAAAQSFYAHRAEQTSPHIMLADLKGQLDAIAVRLSKREEPE